MTSSRGSKSRMTRTSSPFGAGAFGELNRRPIDYDASSPPTAPSGPSRRPLKSETEPSAAFQAASPSFSRALSTKLLVAVWAASPSEADPRIGSAIPGHRDRCSSAGTGRRPGRR